MKLSARATATSNAIATVFEFFSGYRTGVEDRGRHTVSIIATDEFLAYSKAAGNDLSTPMPQYSFPGLKAGDRWCLVALRWKQALDDGMAPQVLLEATHESVLEIVDLDVLRDYAVTD